MTQSELSYDSERSSTQRDGGYEHPLGGSDYARQLGEMRDRFTRDWYDRTNFDRGTGSRESFETTQFRIRTGDETGLNLGKDVGKSDTLYGSLLNLAQGKVDQISDVGADKLKSTFELLRTVMETKPDRVGTDVAKEINEYVLTAVLNKFGFETGKQWAEREAREEIERREFADKWTESHANWWRSESDHADWQRYDKTRVKGEPPEQRLP
jgi:hypothetical protein